MDVGILSVLLFIYKEIERQGVWVISNCKSYKSVLSEDIPWHIVIMMIRWHKERLYERLGSLEGKQGWEEGQAKKTHKPKWGSH